MTDPHAVSHTRLDGRIAIVTGGARGIGRAIAQALADAGARLVLVDLGCTVDGRPEDPRAVEAAAAEIGGDTVALSADVADPETAQAAVRAALDRFGAVDIVVNNAAILRDAFVFKASPADFDAVLRTNLSGAFHLTAAAAPVLREQAKQGRGGEAGWGAVVNIVSTAGMYGNFGQAAYASAKAGLLGLTRVTALDLARSRVTCNAVAPFARTRVTETIIPQNEAQTAYKDRAMRVPAERVAAFVAYLVSDRARDITGQYFGVRGREAFLFSQPRPAARAVAPADIADAGGLDAAVRRDLAGAMADLSTDLEAFNTEPVL